MYFDIVTMCLVQIVLLNQIARLTNISTKIESIDRSKISEGFQNYGSPKAYQMLFLQFPVEKILQKILLDFC